MWLIAESAKTVDLNGIGVLLGSVVGLLTFLYGTKQGVNWIRQRRQNGRNDTIQGLREENQRLRSLLKKADAELAKMFYIHELETEIAVLKERLADLEQPLPPSDGSVLPSSPSS